MKRLLAHFAIFLTLGAIGAAAVVWGGLYDISATDEHLRPTFVMLKKALERSVELRAKNIEVPPLGDAAQVRDGARIFEVHCVQCHGGPGVAPEPFALALRPLATPLARSGRDRDPRFLYWVVRNGIKMTGMPAWEFRLDERQTWAVVAFVKRLPELSPADYAALMRSGQQAAASTVSDTTQHAPDRERGRKALEQYGCVGCHEIPRMVGPEARLGPTLHGVASRKVLAGILDNTPENLQRFIREPQRVKPGSAMPDLGVTERDARDMAAHMATFR